MIRRKISVPDHTLNQSFWSAIIGKMARSIRWNRDAEKGPHFQSERHHLPPGVSHEYFLRGLP